MVSNNRAFAGARDGMTGTGAVMRQDIGGHQGGCMPLLEMQAKQRQEISRRADARRLLKRPEQGLYFRGAAALLHAGVVVRRIGRGLAGLQVGLVEILRRQGGVLPAPRVGGRWLPSGLLDGRDRASGLSRAGALHARLLEALRFFALPSPVGATQDSRLLGRVGMMVPEMMRAGRVPPVGALGVEDARRGHQEYDEEHDAHEPANRVHRCSRELSGSYVEIVQASTRLWDESREASATWGDSGQPKSTEAATGPRRYLDGYFRPIPVAMSLASPTFPAPASILSTTTRICVCSSSASRSLSAWTIPGKGHEA